MTFNEDGPCKVYHDMLHTSHSVQMIEAKGNFKTGTAHSKFICAGVFVLSYALLNTEGESNDCLGQIEDKRIQYIQIELLFTVNMSGCNMTQSWVLFSLASVD